MSGKSSAKSYRLPYSKPRNLHDTPAMPQTAERIDPIAYIKCWHKHYPGEAVDITKAKPMTRADLMKADPRGIELIFAYGVTQKELARQYNTPLGSLAAIFKRTGVNTKVDLIVGKPPSDPTPEASDDKVLYGAVDPEQKDVILPEVPEPIIWFSSNKKKNVMRVTVYPSGRLSLSHEIGQHFSLDDQAAIGIGQGGNVLKLQKTSPGLRVAYDGKKKDTGERKAIACSAVAKKLVEFGISLPAKYLMEPDDIGFTGKLADDL